ncbi:LacI family DNA-binding transcriptional regulator [Novosphingobium sp. 1949]|uniref:LacI family DNA-binding transcriptional regulator n=1 Tax=Novosphingobium organovorum TaxID=2930092 RepID=A0ABT0B8X1_9SPHN|nr:LacI family DNA-binding transcriptional regulator [Novosphingobium organovorum]MCJ2181448.1 LacI family DNA-binding transcriptional regulator [Novosphingobium organovorum]
MGRKPSNRPTSFDIAYRAGVSQPTVSRALRGSKSISEATRKRIEAIARELNYSVDKNASSLRSQRSNTIALLFFEEDTPDDAKINPFFLAMLSSITRHCASRGLDLLISFQRMEDNWHTRYLDSHRADGLILLGYGDYTLYRSRLRELVDHGTHFVRWGAVDDPAFGAAIGSDNRQAGLMAGAHLIGLGRRRIAFLGQADEHYPEFAERYAGLCEALEAAGIAPDPALRRDTISHEALGRAAMEDILASGTRFDGVFAASDLIALGAMAALRAAGLSAPEDVALIGFDDLPAAAMNSPALTTIAQDMKGAGERLVETLLARIEDREPPSPLLETRLVLRESAPECPA